MTEIVLHEDRESGIIETASEEESFEQGVSIRKRSTPAIVFSDMLTVGGLLTIKQLMALTGWSRTTIDLLRKEQKLKEIRTGPNNGRVQITLQSLNEYLTNTPERQEEAAQIRNKLHDVRSKASKSQ